MTAEDKEEILNYMSELQKGKKIPKDIQILDCLMEKIHILILGEMLYNGIIGKVKLENL